MSNEQDDLSEFYNNQGGDGFEFEDEDIIDVLNLGSVTNIRLIQMVWHSKSQEPMLMVEVSRGIETEDMELTEEEVVEICQTQNNQRIQRFPEMVFEQFEAALWALQWAAIKDKGECACEYVEEQEGENRIAEFERLKEDYISKDNPRSENYFGDSEDPFSEEGFSDLVDVKFHMMFWSNSEDQPMIKAECVKYSGLLEPNFFTSEALYDLMTYDQEQAPTPQDCFNFSPALLEKLQAAYAAIAWATHKEDQEPFSADTANWSKQAKKIYRELTESYLDSQNPDRQHLENELDDDGPDDPYNLGFEDWRLG